MENEINQATLCPTKAGNGFKMVINGKWLYASKWQVQAMVSGKREACVFHALESEQ